MAYKHKAMRVWEALKRAANLEEAIGIVDHFNLSNQEGSQVLKSWIMNQRIMREHGII
ncbi:MAG: hypothetical protein PHG06_00255 [Parabacteroides sp.]|nr:hypothetical protein [Parabacteroides sp.]